MKPYLKLLAVSAFAALPIVAQSTIKDSMVKHWKTSGEFTMEVAKAMPAESYDFRPVPEEMSFGQVMSHIAVADLGACATASGMQRPEIPSNIAGAMKEKNGKFEKDSVVSFLNSTFDFCNQAVASMTPEKLDATVGTQRKMTGYEWLWSYFTHTAHHRGQAEVYLRLKGVAPPSYKF